MAGLQHALASFVALLSLSSYVTASPVEARGAQLPVVDLGYVVQRATEFNNTGRYYNFSNIRYAAPPTGNLRWRAPQPPAKNRAKVDTGSQKRICPQATVGWETYGENFVISTLLGVPFTQTVPLKQDFTNITLPAADPRVTEDCLFLDVFVPEEIFANADNCGKPNTGAPVLVWIFGGGYVEGDKTASGSPSGLLARSEAAPNDGGVIYVAMNYRLGAFGFMAGNEIKSNGIANAGLLDQRFALEWVQNNIHKFGGDPRRVTVFGESAGGGSIVHQLTAYGGAKGRVPFHQAVPQSPGWVPAISPKQQDAAQQGFFKLAGVSSFKEARAASTETLMAANYRQIYNSFYGTFTYGPVTDGVFVPEQPMHLLKVGDFDRSVKVMVGHNADEGLAFTPPNAANETVWDEFLAQTLPLASQATLDHISNTVYPPKYDGSQGYTNPIGRAATAIAELVFTCNTYYLEEAFNGKTYSYEFAVPPAIHGQDVGWTYFTGTDKTPNAKPSALNPYAITNVTVAIALQEFITSFAEKGVPEAMPGIPKFVTYGKDARIEILNSTGVTTGTDDVSKTRCQFWQSGAFLGKNPWKNDPER